MLFGKEWKELKSFENLSESQRSIVFYAENKASINHFNSLIHELTENMNIEHHSTFCDHQTDSSLFDKVDYYRKNKLINVFYTGITANPPKHITNTFIDKGLEVDRDPIVVREVLHNNGKIYTPWWNIDKKKLAQIYEEYNLIDSLFAYTRSCEWVPSYQGYSAEGLNIGLGHCGKCWWCQEREWGFNRL